jgi:hypothetical protein
MALNLTFHLNCNQNHDFNCNKNRNNNGNRRRQRNQRYSSNFENWSRVDFPQRSATFERNHQEGNRIRGEGKRRASALPPPCEGPPIRWSQERAIE